MASNVIETRDLTVRYGSRPGVTDLDLAVQEGEVFGFLGPNGAGKTTTMRVLLDVIRPWSGEARVFGLDCRRDGPRIRRRLGYIPGELHLYPQLTARSYLRLVDAVRGHTAEKEYLHRLCERLDLDPNRRMREYSRGNKQKVGLVAAFMGKPELLILDEPTGGLDPLVQQTVLELVREARNEGRTVFFSSHILPEVQAVCDRVGIIREGRLVTTESVDSLTGSQLHRLRLRFRVEPPAGAFELTGVREVSRLDSGVLLEVSDNLNEVLRRASALGVVDLETHTVTLEEVFLAHYGRGNGGGERKAAAKARESSAPGGGDA